MVSKQSDQPDRRTVKTQRQLKKIFVKLLHEKPIDKITVAELARASDIGRGTFYIHYKDVYDLYDSVVADTVNQLTQIFEKYYPRDGDNQFTPLAAQIVKFILDNQQLFEALTHYGEDVRALKHINALFVYYVLEAEHIDTTNTKYRDAVSFASCGLIGTLTEWLTAKSASSVDDIVTVISKSIAAMREVAVSLKSPS
ncbi:TetR/AcrR family transcriptional regulator [Secundilactobacillus yichangensis]|uniref:TetR/AcrR family transcriptional regulator n=1 Tax=Secundilactobacillus yichangensis TaxID=2799580 RepID=UPI0019438028|nr:TetR/AcrR family transcriptional regulator [Secundilactobacillus yichangensis]